MDNDESRNALYEKSRRIIRNQALIQILGVFVCGIGTLALTDVMFWLVFGVAPGNRGSKHPSRLGCRLGQLHNYAVAC